MLIICILLLVFISVDTYSKHCEMYSNVLHEDDVYFCFKKYSVNKKIYLI